MNYSPNGYYTPPENDCSHDGFLTQNENGWHSGPEFSQFVSFETWNREKRYIRKLSIISAASVLLFILLSSVFSTAVQVLMLILRSNEGFDYNAFAEKWNSAEFQYLFSAIYSIIIVGGPFFAVGYISGKKGYLNRIPAGKPQNARFLPVIVIGAFGICLFGNIITNYIDAIVQIIFGFNMQYPEMPATPRSVLGIFLFYLSTAIVPALIEEMALRGIIMQSLRRYGDMFAIICSALIFGLMHRNLLQIPFAFIAGIAIGYAVIITESIWTGILIHFLNNAFSVTVSIISDFYGIESVAYSICNTIFYIIIGSGLFCTFIYLKMLNKKPLKKSPLVNCGKNFYGPLPAFSARISNSSLYKNFLFTAPLVIAFIAVLYETIIATIAF